MRKSLFCGLTLCVLALAGVRCGKEATTVAWKKSGPRDGGSPADGAVALKPVTADTGGKTDGPKPRSDLAVNTDARTAQGGCMNPSDSSLIAKGLLPQKNSCDQQCATDKDRLSCVAACLHKNPGLSQGCAECYTVLNDCILEKCYPSCSVPTDAKKRDECYADCSEKNCTPAFRTCKGLPH
jgi:hypothetical protein